MENGLLEAFLICALSLPPAVSPRHGDGHKRYLKMLLVNAGAERIYEMRRIGVPAVGALTLDRRDITPFHAVCEAASLPFKVDSMFMVAWYHPNPIRAIHYDYLTQIDFVLKEGGYLAFNPEYYPGWLAVLRIWGWTQKETMFDAMPVYQKPIQSSA